MKVYTIEEVQVSASSGRLSIETPEGIINIPISKRFHIRSGHSSGVKNVYPDHDGVEIYDILSKNNQDEAFFHVSVCLKPNFGKILVEKITKLLDM